jgi:hypothetical protein
MTCQFARNAGKRLQQLRAALLAGGAQNLPTRRNRAQQ